MAARDKLLERTRPLLDDGEGIGRVFPAASGIHPVIGIITLVAGVVLTNSGVPFFYGVALMVVGIMLLAQVRNLVVAVTDRGVVVTEAGMLFAFRPKQVIARLPEDVQVGPAQGFLWKKVQGLSEALDTPVRVHIRFVNDAVGAGPGR